MKRLVPLLLAGLAFFFSMTTTASSAPSAKTASLVLGGGCFWCTEAAYELLPGVKAVVSGYAGGETIKPSYEDICTGETGHAEVIRIDYDPAKVTLERVLEYFWDIHDPTTLNRQGADAGTQYRSTIMYADETQRIAAEASRAAAQKDFRDPIVTEIVPLKKFWPAEDYHQDYFRKNPHAGYCSVVIAPKVKKLEKKLSAEKQ